MMSGRFGIAMVVIGMTRCQVEGGTGFFILDESSISSLNLVVKSVSHLILSVFFSVPKLMQLMME